MRRFWRVSGSDNKNSSDFDPLTMLTETVWQKRCGQNGILIRHGRETRTYRHPKQTTTTKKMTDGKGDQETTHDDILKAILTKHHWSGAFGEPTLGDDTVFRNIFSNKNGVVCDEYLVNANTMFDFMWKAYAFKLEQNPPYMFPPLTEEYIDLKFGSDMIIRKAVEYDFVPMLFSIFTKLRDVLPRDDDRHNERDFCGRMYGAWLDMIESMSKKDSDYVTEMRNHGSVLGMTRGLRYLMEAKSMMVTLNESDSVLAFANLSASNLSIASRNCAPVDCAPDEKDKAREKYTSRVKAFLSSPALDIHYTPLGHISRSTEIRNGRRKVVVVTQGITREQVSRLLDEISENPKKHGVYGKLPVPYDYLMKRRRNCLDIALCDNLHDRSANDTTKIECLLGIMHMVVGNVGDHKYILHGLTSDLVTETYSKNNTNYGIWENIKLKVDEHVVVLIREAINLGDDIQSNNIINNMAGMSLFTILRYANKVDREKGLEPRNFKKRLIVMEKSIISDVLKSIEDWALSLNLPNLKPETCRLMECVYPVLCRYMSEYIYEMYLNIETAVKYLISNYHVYKAAGIELVEYDPKKNTNHSIDTLRLAKLKAKMLSVPPLKSNYAFFPRSIIPYNNALKAGKVAGKDDVIELVYDRLEKGTHGPADRQWTSLLSHVAFKNSYTKSLSPLSHDVLRKTYSKVYDGLEDVIEKNSHIRSMSAVVKATDTKVIEFGERWLKFINDLPTTRWEDGSEHWLLESLRKAGALYGLGDVRNWNRMIKILGCMGYWIIRRMGESENETVNRDNITVDIMRVAYMLSECKYNETRISYYLDKTKNNTPSYGTYITQYHDRLLSTVRKYSNGFALYLGTLIGKPSNLTDSELLCMNFIRNQKDVESMNDIENNQGNEIRLSHIICFREDLLYYRNVLAKYGLTPSDMLDSSHLNEYGVTRVGVTLMYDRYAMLNERENILVAVSGSGKIDYFGLGIYAALFSFMTKLLVIPYERSKGAEVHTFDHDNIYGEDKGLTNAEDWIDERTPFTSLFVASLISRAFTRNNIIETKPIPKDVAEGETKEGMMYYYSLGVAIASFLR